jgi:hypothetical protein
VSRFTAIRIVLMAPSAPLGAEERAKATPGGKSLRVVTAQVKTALATSS